MLLSISIYFRQSASKIKVSHIKSPRVSPPFLRAIYYTHFEAIFLQNFFIFLNFFKYAVFACNKRCIRYILHLKFSQKDSGVKIVVLFFWFAHVVIFFLFFRTVEDEDSYNFFINNFWSSIFIFFIKKAAQRLLLSSKYSKWVYYSREDSAYHAHYTKDESYNRISLKETEIASWDKRG